MYVKDRFLVRDYDARDLFAIIGCVFLLIPVLYCDTYPTAKISKIDTVALQYATWTVVRQRTEVRQRTLHIQ